MKAIAHRAYQPTMTPDIENFTIDRETGLLAEEPCKNTIQLPFIKGTQPQTKSPCATGSKSGWFDNLFGND